MILPRSYSENSDFQDLSFLVIAMYSITLYAIDMHGISCLEPFLPLYDHFEIWRFFGLICKLDLILRPS